MTRTIKKALTVFLLLCLTMALGAAALASEAGQVTRISAEVSDGAQAGKAITTITVKAEGGNFKSDAIETSAFTVNGQEVGLDEALIIQSVSGAGTATAVLTMQQPVIPTKAGNITVTANEGAFDVSSTPDAATIHVEPAAALTVSTTNELTAGQDAGMVTLTISNPGNNSFATTSSKDPNFSIEGDSAVTLTSVSAGSNTATLTLTGKPTKSGTITVTMQPAAFTYQPSGDTTCDIEVKAADNPTVTASASSGLVAGTQGTIELSIDGVANTFVNSPAANLFTLTNCNSTNPSQVSGSGQKVTLTVTPTNTQGVIVTIDPKAFTYQPKNSVSCASVSVSAPTVTASASGELTQGVAGGKITVTISDDNDTFKSDLGTNYTGMFTVNVGAATLEVTGVERAEKTATLTMAAPTTKDTVSVKIDKKAFTYEAATDVTASSSVTINAPTGTVTAALVGNQLYAGTAVSGQTIKLTINGDLTFNSSLNTGDASKFTLNGTGSADLSVTDVTYTSGSEVSLTLSGTPKTAGTFGVNIDNGAFTYAPDTPAKTDESITVNDAPTVTLELVGTVTAGDTKEINIKIKSPDYVKFAAEPTPSNFTVDGQQVSGVSITDSGIDKNVKLTLSAAPSAAGSDNLTIKVLKGAFTPVAINEPEVKVSVQAPTGDVTGSLEGSLTAGTAVSGQTIKLKIGDGGTLNFKAQEQLQGAFSLSEGTGLTISSVTRSDSKNVTLNLTGTPAKGGNFTVSITADAFVAAPVSVPVTVSGLNINYPAITLTANLSRITEDTEIGSITLTAEGGVFKQIDADTAEASNFSISGNNDFTLMHVKADEGSDQVTLTVTGKTETQNALTITVKKEAFKYEPQTDPQAVTIPVGQPTGDLSVALNGGDLYKGTPVSGQTITVKIEKSDGLHFQSDLEAGNFNLTGAASGGLTIQSVVRDSETQATLTLTGAPEASGDFQVTALKEAFMAAPQGDSKTSTNAITVQPAPSGTVTAALSGPLYAGTAADGTTVTLTATGLTFASSVDKSSFTLTGTYADMTIADAKLSDGKIVLTLSGTPKAAGAFQVQVANSAFTVYPAGSVTSSAVTVGAANIKLTLSDNGLQAGKKDMTFTVTPSGGKLIDLANRAAAIDTGEDLKGLTLGDMTQNADGSVTVTVMGMPPVAGSITLTLQPSMFDPQPAQAVSVTVPVAEGEQAAEPDTKPGAPGIGFTAPVEDLASAVLTPEEQALYEKGAQVLIELVESPGAQVPEADKTAVEAAAGDYIVGEYLDVSLIKTINGVSGTVSETNKPIQVVFTIPQDLQAAGRQFAVIRVHEGKAELLKTVASTATTITVESDLFSTYAIVYQEAPASTDKPDATPAPTTAPHTGDETPLLGWTALLLGCAAALVLTTAAALRRRRDRG